MEQTHEGPALDGGAQRHLRPLAGRVLPDPAGAGPLRDRARPAFRAAELTGLVRPGAVLGRPVQRTAQLGAHGRAVRELDRCDSIRAGSRPVVRAVVLDHADRPDPTRGADHDVERLAHRLIGASHSKALGLCR